MAAVHIITARELGLSFQNLFGELGPERFVTGHWTAGPIDDSLQHGIQLCKSYHASHRAKGWGGIGYHYSILRHTHRGKPVILCLRPTVLKGAHVGMHNTSNIGVMFHGGAPGEIIRPSITQRQAFEWLLDHAHLRVMPRAHRTDRNLSNAQRLGHNDWQGHESNQCPGNYKRLIRSGGTAR